MVISELNGEQVIYLMRRTLELPSVDKHVIDDILLAGSIRRAATFLCPCSPNTLINYLALSLRSLVDDEDLLGIRIDEAINRLIVGGDLLELSNVSTNDLNAKGTWIFAAPPSFVVRPNGKIFILGLVNDENSPIPSFSSRIIYRGFKRIIQPNLNEQIEVILRDLGLIPLSEKAWLKLPKKTFPDKYLSDMLNRLPGEFTGSIDDLEILNSDRAWNFYRQRWTKVKNETGFYVAKRAQQYGAPIWCLTELEQGIVKQFIDLPLSINSISQRGCDTGWHLQIAFDLQNKKPHHFRVRDFGDEKILDFFSPIPLWAERRLMALGESVMPFNCLFSYSIPKEEYLAEANFLAEYLWMQPQT
jgi:hypothetical protein